MEEAAQELHNHFQATAVHLPPQDINFQALSAEQVQQFGQTMDSNQAVATFLATLQLKSEHESKLARHLMSKTLFATINTVQVHSQDISQLKNIVSKTEASHTILQTNQADIYTQLEAVKHLSAKSYLKAAENKQRSAKGNFIVSGDAIPPFTLNENLFDKVFPFILEKYGIQIHPYDLKELHRLPNKKVLFSLVTRLPGQCFESLVRATNSNPKSHIKVYISIQLFEPFAEHFYIARRLKYFKLITNYRLDENGNTMIAFRQDTLSFKLTGVEQLESLGLSFPHQLKDEIIYRRSQIKSNEERNVQLNNQKAFQQRPNFRPQHQNQTQSNNMPEHQTSFHNINRAQPNQTTHPNHPTQPYNPT